jgi:hypothetical protein
MREPTPSTASYSDVGVAVGSGVGVSFALNCCPFSVQCLYLESADLKWTARERRRKVVWCKSASREFSSSYFSPLNKEVGS